MEGWRDAKWGTVRANMQLTANHYGFNEHKLAEMFGSVKPTGWIVDLVNNISPAMADITARVTFAGGVHKTMSARLVKESAPFVPDEDGVWGVAPLSVLAIHDDI